MTDEATDIWDTVQRRTQKGCVGGKLLLICPPGTQSLFEKQYGDSRKVIESYIFEEDKKVHNSSNAFLHVRNKRIKRKKR